MTRFHNNCTVVNKPRGVNQKLKLNCELISRKSFIPTGSRPLDTRTPVRLAANEVFGAENFDQLLVSRDIGQVDLDSTPQIRIMKARFLEVSGWERG
jgi:hypothetical protein